MAQPVIILHTFANAEDGTRVDVHPSDAVEAHPFGATLIDEDSGETVVTICYATEALAVAKAMELLN